MMVQFFEFTPVGSSNKFSQCINKEILIAHFKGNQFKCDIVDTTTYDRSTLNQKVPIVKQLKNLFTIPLN
jgi:hypothetical protein